MDQVIEFGFAPKIIALQASAAAKELASLAVKIDT